MLRREKNTLSTLPICTEPPASMISMTSTTSIAPPSPLLRKALLLACAAATLALAWALIWLLRW